MDQFQGLKSIPNDRILLESDSPYMSPIGKECNTPSFIGDVASRVAAHRDIYGCNLIRMATSYMNNEFAFNRSFWSVVDDFTVINLGIGIPKKENIFPCEFRYLFLARILVNSYVSYCLFYFTRKKLLHNHTQIQSRIEVNSRVNVRILFAVLLAQR